MSPDAPFVSECRLNASCWTMKSIEIVTMAKVAARTRTATQAIGSAARATPRPTTGSTSNGR